MGPAVQHDASRGDAHAANYIVLLLELAVKGVFRAVHIERGRQIAFTKP